MVGSGKKIEYRYCHDNEQQHQHEHGSRNIAFGFFHGYPSHHLHHHRGGHIQTNDDQFSSESSRNLEEGRPIGLTLMKSMSLIEQLQLTLTGEKQQNNHQEVLSHPPPGGKLKASNFPALFIKIGSWVWASKTEGDLVVKFYYGKKKVVWEFLYGSRKRKIEIGWSHVSAINAFVDEEKKGRLEIQLDSPPEYYKEVKFQPRKHTQWETTSDFTGGQAHICRRHTLLFSPGVLDGPFKKLLQYDNRLLNLSRQRIPTHENLDFSFNRNVNGCPSIPFSNIEHQGSVLPYAKNLLQPASSFVGHSGCSLPMTGPNLQNSGEIATEVLYQDYFVPPIREKDHYLPYQRMTESWTPYQQLEWGMNIQNVTEYTNQQNCYALTQNHENNSNAFGNWTNDWNHQEARKNDSSSSGSVMNIQTAHPDDEICSFNEQEISDVLAFLDGYRP